jgi:hypothetical protein
MKMCDAFKYVNFLNLYMMNILSLDITTSSEFLLTDRNSS